MSSFSSSFKKIALSLIVRRPCRNAGEGRSLLVGNLPRLFTRFDLYFLPGPEWIPLRTTTIGTVTAATLSKIEKFSERRDLLFQQGGFDPHDGFRPA